MKEDEVITRLAKENQELKEELLSCRGIISDIEMKLVGIGGALNDSKIVFNKEQKRFLHEILSLVSI
uniref:Uncharacterized protein n=2 Tax=viral metagenome TaxID=1070528 RepID=A0A6M3J3U9_9ZZZZ